MNNNTTNILFIDSSVDNYNFLLEGVVVDIEKVVLDSKRDGIEQITDVLVQRSGVETVHIVSHGSPGCLYLGNSELSLGNLEYYIQQLENWDCENLLLYGCNLAAGDAGEEFVEKLHRLTSANIAASKTKTGNAELGGNWELEIRVGKDFAVEKDISLIFGQDTLAKYSGVFAPGDLDATFGNGGKVITALSTDGDRANDVAIQADGKIVVLGSVNIGSNSENQYTLTRYNVDGTLDTTFGNDGKVMTQIEHTFSSEGSLIISPNGNILITGSVNSTSGGYVDFLLAQFNADGTPTSSFGNNGVITTAVGTWTDKANSIALQADGKIILGGDYRNTESDSRDFALVRYNANGSLDGSFGDGGKVATELGGDFDIIESVAVLPNGKILAGGYIQENSSSKFALVRYNSDGSLDNNFGDGGKVVTSIKNSLYENAFTMAVQADGKVILAGRAGSDFALVRYNNDGSMDSQFGNGGIVTTDVVGGSSISKIMIQPDGKIVGVANINDYTQTSNTWDFAVVRYNRDGSLDNSFGDNGIALTDIGGGDDRANSVALQSDGKIVVVGEANGDSAIARYQVNPNENPSIAITNNTLNYTENALQIIDAEATVTDIDSPNFNNGTLTVRFTSGSTKNDRLSIRNQGTEATQINVENTVIKYGDVEIGTFSGGVGAEELVVSLNENATPTAVQELLRNITYQNVSDNPDTTERNLEFIVTDDQGGSSEAASKTISITAVNDAPIIDKPFFSVDENAEKGTVVGTLTATDAEGTTDFSDWKIRSNSSFDLDGDGESPFAINANTGEITVNDSDDLNYENTPYSYVEVSVSDGQNSSSSQSIKIELNDVKGTNVEGTSDNDILYGTPETEIISGKEGNDNIYGMGGGDTLNGGEGIDTIRETRDGDFQLDDERLIIHNPSGRTTEVNQLESIERAVLIGGNNRNRIDAKEFSGNVYLSGKGGDDSLTGGRGNDNLSGGEGNDSIEGGEGIDTVRETADADFRLSTSGTYMAYLHAYAANTKEKLGSDRLISIERLSLTGGESNNIVDVRSFNGDVNLSGKGGDDSLAGGRGNDILSGGEGNDYLDGGEGIDTVRETADADFRFLGSSYSSSGEYNGSLESYAADGGKQIASDRLEDVEKIYLTGGESNNKIDAERVWSDVNLKGLGGDDTLIGGYGVDTLSGGEGNDSLDGGYGFDIVREIADVSFQIKGTQLIATDSNTNEQLSIDKFRYIQQFELTGGESNNIIDTSDTSEFDGYVNLKGLGGNDSLKSGSANDTLSGGEGSDTIDGGNGIDTVIESADVNFQLTDSQLTSTEVKTGKTVAIDELRNIERVVLTAGESNNKIDASEFSGNVNISGKDGNDTLVGGSSNDNLSGGKGNDTIDGGEGIDTIRESADADFRILGNRYLHSYDSKTRRTLSRDTFTNIERISLTAGESNNRLEAIDFYGNVNLSGKGGDDNLVSGYFNDTLSGGEGSDTIDGREGIDTLRERGDVNFTLTDTQLRTSETERGNQLDSDRLISIEKASLTGGESRNQIYAKDFSGSVNLSGKGGNDTLVGGRSNDTISGGTGSDTIDGGEGIDSLRETADVDFELEDFRLITKDSNSNRTLDTDKIQNIERVSLTSGGRDNKIIASNFSGSVNISGEGGRDTLVGGSANDTLSGGKDDDTLNGGEGIDTLRETADVDFRFTSSSSSSRTPYNGTLYSYKANTRESWGRDRLEDIEKLALTGGDSDNQFDVQNFKGNVNLSGKGGNDTLIGGIGNDSFSGGEGSDIIDGGDGVDSLRETADVNFKLEGNPQRNYRLISSDSQTLKQLSIDNIQSIEKISLSGGESNNKIDASQAYMSVNLSGKGGSDTVIGGFYNDILSGGEGSDTIDGGEGIDTLRETADADFRILGNRIASYDSSTRRNLAEDEIESIEKISLTGGESNNRLEAREFDGNVNLSGKGGNDFLFGGRGNDTLSGGEGNDTIDGEEGIDTLRESADVDFRLKNSNLYTYEVNSSVILDRDKLISIERASLTGGESNNELDAEYFEGDVNLSGKGGKDTLLGGSGNDTLSGGTGDDTLDGGDGIDTLRESADVDFRLTGTGSLYSYELGRTTILDKDSLKDIERISLTGGESNNKIDASKSKDSVNLSGKGGRDTLLGGSGNDTLSGGEDYDSLDGGEGVDTIRETADVDFELDDKQLQISQRTQTITQRTTDRLTSIERAILTGGEYGNRIDARQFTGNVNLSGKGGNDTLSGGSGNDNLSGGIGDDTIDGGDGIDTLREVADVDFKLESYSSPNDDYQLKSYDSQFRQLLSTDRITNVEKISLTGGDRDNKFDAAQAYTSVNFAGKGGNDTLIGGYGNDTFSGGVGNDFFGGGDGIDTIKETADADFRVTRNRIDSYDSITENLDRDEFYDIERISLTGGQSNNLFEARDFDAGVKFSGKAGDDTLLGGRGNDTLSGGIGNDTIDGAEGIDTIQETADVDFRVKGNQLESIEAGTQTVLGTDEFRNIERIFLSGGESNNTIDAKDFAGNVNLSGKGGKDNLLGGRGNDTLSGGEGYDILNGGEGIDTVRETADVDFKLTNTGSLETYKTNTTTILDKDLLKNIERISLTGGESNNKIDASEYENSVNLAGKAGNDSLLGGSGNDTFSGGTGSDTIDGGNGIDTFRETADVDFKLTNTGSLESYEANTDTVLDTDLLQNIERISLTGGESNNKIDASEYENRVNLAGKGGNDSLLGGNGNDTLSGGNGNDTIDGGSGTDYLRETANGNFLLTDNNLTISDFQSRRELGKDDISNIERAILSGGNSNNTIDARKFTGSVNLYGRDGNDTLMGGNGNDNLYGGSGDDTLDGGEGIDTVRETADANFRLSNDYLDSNEANTGRTLGRDRLVNIERAALTGGESNNLIDASAYTGTSYLYGKDGNDTLLGGSGNDYVKAGSGDDLINGGIGSDRLYGGSGKDTFVLSSVTGKDTIYDFEDGVDSLGLSDGLTFSDLNIKAIGNNTNIIQGNQTLATLIGIDSSLIDQSDFTSV